jgi:hypothetical protein
MSSDRRRAEDSDAGFLHSKIKFLCGKNRLGHKDTNTAAAIDNTITDYSCTYN